MKRYYVLYMVEKADYEAGPYDTFEQAKTERADIEGYEGVYNVTIVEREEP